MIRENQAPDGLEFFARQLERELAAETKYREALFARLLRYEVPPTMIETGCWPDRKCEGCDSAAVTSDPDGIPLCAECARACDEELDRLTPINFPPEPREYHESNAELRGVTNDDLRRERNAREDERDQMGLTRGK
jgi:hypothetical protein